MSMIVLSLTQSYDCTLTHQTNGQTTGKTLFSENGVNVDALLTSPNQYHLRDKPDRIRMSLNFKVDQMPNLPPAEVERWIRHLLLEMLNEADEGEDKT